MPIEVGNLLEDLSAQSFISLEDAETYLSVENTPEWDVLEDADKEKQLVAASRWIAYSFRFAPLTPRGLIVVGRAAAKLAAETVGLQLFDGADGQLITMEKVGSLQVEYSDATRSDAAGLSFPWLHKMLWDYTYTSTRRGGLGVLVV